MNENTFQQKENVSDLIQKLKNNEINNQVKSDVIPKMNSFNPSEHQKTLSKETDPDLIITHEIVKLPSKGLFYKNNISEIALEYMTSKDEDILTTPSLLESGIVLDILLKRKIKTPNIIVEDLLPGDRNAIILFLRTSSYGVEYRVQVQDPRTGIPFNETVDLSKLSYKELDILPDENGLFNVFIPKRQKNIKFKLLSSGEDTLLFKKAEAIKEAYNNEFSEYSTMKLKSSIIAINEKTDRSYIDRFVDAMPGLDATIIRREIHKVSPDINMSYEFTAKDGYKFNASLVMGVDFFFPSH